MRGEWERKGKEGCKVEMVNGKSKREGGGKVERENRWEEARAGKGRRKGGRIGGGR